MPAIGISMPVVCDQLRLNGYPIPALSPQSIYTHLPCEDQVARGWPLWPRQSKWRPANGRSQRQPDIQPLCFPT
ncbi:hypothetical protein R75465_07541 [Paraburkholderia aspalathi]|nr:hypothetical protein R75465_07541 [Paraburkholderia aspalathi]